MIYKNLILFSVIVGTILVSIMISLAYYIPIEEQKRIKELPLVKNCVPVDPDGVVPSVKIIGNYTHTFDLRNCKWITNDEMENFGYYPRCDSLGTFLPTGENECIP